jgi:D-sedoheptulose 7-phosphate isomerase
VGFVEEYLQQSKQIIDRLDTAAIAEMARRLVELRGRHGRLFILGVGGSAGSATHAVNDFRKLTDIESYAPTDNVSELTARTNDEGWETVFVQWLRGSRLSPNDMLLVLSVGGGNLEKNVSANLVRAVQYGKEIGAGILGIVGRDGGYTAKAADACVIVPTVHSATVTPHTESFHSLICHLLVSHPDLQVKATKW